MSKPQNDFSDEGFRACGEAVSQLGLNMTGWRPLTMTVLSLKVKAPAERGLEFFGIVVAIDGEGREWVAFHSAMTLEEVFRGVWARLANGSLKWRENQPYSPAR